MKLIPTKRTLKRWAIGFGMLLGLVLLINGIIAWRIESRFQRLIEAVRDEGDPASIDELATRPIPADRNAAALIDAMKPKLIDFANEYGEFYRTDLGERLAGLQAGELPNDEQVEAMRAMLERHAELEQQIREAMSVSQYATTADFSLGFNQFMEEQLAKLQHLRTIARFVDWRVQVLLADGDQQQAIDWSLSLLKLSALCKAEPTIVSYLATVAMRNIALNGLHQSLLVDDLDAATYAEIDAALGSLEPDIRLEPVFRTERALSISACIEQGWKRLPPVIGNFLGWPIRRNFLGPIELYDKVIPLADQPYHSVQKEFQAGGDLAVPTGKGVLADLLVPSVKAAMKARNRDLATIRSLRVLNALRQAGDDGQGLEDVDLPDAWTTDPFTGQTLVVRKTDGGWLVYSLGENKADDGGMFDEARDVGFGTATGGEEGDGGG